MNSPIDSRPSTSRWKVKDDGTDLRWYLEVRGLGILTILVSTDWNDPKGKTKPERLGLLTLSELTRDPEPLP